MKIALSPTQIALWASCHRAWYYRHIAGIKPPRGKFAVWGNILHGGLEAIAKGGGCPTHEEILTQLLAVPDTNAGEAARVGRAITAHLGWGQVWLSANPAAFAEETWTWETTDFVLTARTDYVGKDGRVVDYKLKTKYSVSDQREVLLQLACCGLEDGGVLLFDRENGANRKEVFFQFGTWSEIQDLAYGLAAGVARGIAAGDDAPTGTYGEAYGGPRCRWCDFWNLCPYGRLAKKGE